MPGSTATTTTDQILKAKFKHLLMLTYHRRHCSLKYLSTKNNNIKVYNIKFNKKKNDCKLTQQTVSLVLLPSEGGKQFAAVKAIGM